MLIETRISTVPHFDQYIARNWLHTATAVLVLSVAGILALDRLAVGAEPPQFIRGGIAVEATSEVQVATANREPVEVTDAATLDAGDGSQPTRQLIFFDWSPETEYRLRVGDSAEQLVRSPRAPAPYLVRTVPLEDASAAAAAGAADATGTPPDSIVRFAPDSRRLAIGTLAGHLRVVDVVTGRLLHHERIAEGQIKELVWSPDGRRLYVGEQSPDAALLALDVSDDPADSGSFERAWSVRLAEQLETSRLPADDRYGVYSLPAVHDLAVADDGRIFAVGMHSWTTAAGPQIRSATYSFAPDGSSLWRFPPEGAFRLAITHAAIDAAGTKLLFLASRPLSPQDETRIGGDTLYLLDARSGEQLAEHRIAPLAPHFDRVEAWDSVAIVADGSRAAVGLADGRGLIFDTSAGELALVKTLELGTPILVGGIPVAAACSYTRAIGDTIFFETQNTHIPFGNPMAANRAPAPHRGANTLAAFDLDGQIHWRYRGPFALTGVWGDATGAAGRNRWLIATCRELPGAREPGQFGFLLFDQARAGGGSDRLVYYYATDGPVIFHADISADGRWIAVTEVPAPTADRFELYGTHQVHIMH